MTTNNSLTVTDKIIVLRTIGISDEDIMAIRCGSRELGEVLRQKMHDSMNDPDDSTKCAILCQSILRDGVSYDSMDPEPYLRQISDLRRDGGVFPIDLKGYSPYQSSDGSLFGSSVGSSAGSAAGTAQGSSSGSAADSDTRSGLGAGSAAGRSSGQAAGSAAGYSSGPAAGSPSDTYGYAGNPSTTGYGTSRRQPFALQVSTCPHPILRFLARDVDMLIYAVITGIFFRYVLRIDPLSFTSDALTAWVSSSYILMLLIEPLVLFFFGTTLGKYLMGIRVTAEDGSRLGLNAGYIRSLMLFIFGFGCMLPIVSICTLFLSFRRCASGLKLRWEPGTDVRYDDSHQARGIILCLAAMFLASSLDTVLSYPASKPSNKGPLTSLQLEENCNELIRYSFGSAGLPFNYKVLTEGDMVRGVIFEATENGEKLYGHYDEMSILVGAILGAEKSISGYSLMNKYIPSILSDCFSDFSFADEDLGIQITNKVEMSGYVPNIMYGYLYCPSEQERSFHQTFSIILNDR